MAAGFRTAEEGAEALILAVVGLLAAGAGVLAGCMQQREPPVPGQTARSAPRMGFFFNQDRDGASLAYGRANSDDVRLMLRCEPGKSLVEITDAGDPAEGGGMLILTSGKMQSAVPASLQANEETGGSLAVAHATTALPALDGFRRTGELGVKLGARAYVLTATPGERADIAKFFSACERK